MFVIHYDQHEIILDNCFNCCEYYPSGTLNVDGIGECLLCGQEDCWCEEACSETPVAKTGDGQDVFMRVLKTGDQ